MSERPSELNTPKKPEESPVVDPQKPEKNPPAEVVIDEPKKEGERIQEKDITNETIYFKYLEQENLPIEEKNKKIEEIMEQVRPVYERPQLSSEQVDAFIKEIQSKIFTVENSRNAHKKAKNYPAAWNLQNIELEAHKRVLAELNTLKKELLAEQEIQKKKLQAEEDKKSHPQKEEVVVAPLEKNNDTPPKIQEQALENSSILSAEETKEPVTPKEDPAVLSENFAQNGDGVLTVPEDSSKEVLEDSSSSTSHETQRAPSNLMVSGGEGIIEHRDADVLPPESHPEFVEDKKEESAAIDMDHKELPPKKTLKELVEEFQRGRLEPEFPSPDGEKAFLRPIEHGPGVTPELSDIIQEIGEVQKHSDSRYWFSPLKFLDRMRRGRLERKRAEMEKIEGILAREKEAQELEKEREESGPKKVSEEEEQAIEPAKQWHDAALHNPTQAEVLGEPSQEIPITSPKENELNLEGNPVLQEEKNIPLSSETSPGDQQPGLKVIEEEEQTIEKELEKMSPQERENLGRGIFTLGFKAQEFKDRKMAEACEFIAGDSEHGLGRFFKAAAKKYRTDEVKIQQKVKETRESLRVMQQFQNTGYLLRNTLSHGRNIIDALNYFGVPGLSVFNPFRWCMLGAQAFSFVAGTGKEARLMNPDVMQKQRGDEKDANYIEEAASEAWKIYETVRSSSKNGIVDKESLDRAYKENLPEILLDRLKTVRPGMTTTFMQKLMMLDVKAFAELGKQTKKISPELLAKSLADYDRFVGYCGTVDGVALALHHAELAGRAGVATMSVQTAYLFAKNLPHILSNISTFSSHALEGGKENLVAGLVAGKDAYVSELQGEARALASAVREGFEAGKEHLAAGFTAGKDALSRFEEAPSVVPSQETGSLPADHDSVLDREFPPQETIPVPPSSPPGLSQSTEALSSQTSRSEQPLAPQPVPESMARKAKVIENIGGSVEVARTIETDGVKIELPRQPLAIGKNGPEGAIINHLMERQPQEISREKAGWLAHRMFDRFMGTDEAKELMKTHGIKDKEGLMKLMTRIKEGNVEIDAKGNMHLRNISFVKTAVSRVAEAPLVTEPAPSLAALQEEFAAPRLEPELKTVVNIPGPDQDLYEGRTLILQDQGVPKEVIESLSKEDITSLQSEDLEVYSERVQELSSLGVPPEDIANFPPRELIDENNEHTNTVLANLRKPVLREAGIPDSVVEGMAHHDIRSLHTERIADTAANALSDLEFSEGRVVVQGGRVYAHDYRRGFIDTSKYLNPNYREVLKESGIKNIYFAETKIKDEARFLALYEKALKAFEGKPQARVIKKAIDQLIGGMEKQYGDVFKN